MESSVKNSVRVKSAWLCTWCTCVLILIGLLGPSESAVAGARRSSVDNRSGRRGPASVGDASPAGDAHAPDKAGEALLKTYKNATVKIVVRLEGVPIATGVGTFISADGTLVTNYHVIKSAMANPKATAEFKMADGPVIKNFQVAGCGDLRNIDLCVLKIAHRPLSFFKFKSISGSTGEVVYMIGHPRSGDFTIEKGIVSGARRSTSGVNEVQVNIPMRDGNGGAPIFTTHGELIGIASKFIAEGQNLNVAVSVEEIQPFIANRREFISPVAAYKLIQSTNEKNSEAGRVKFVEPALRAALHGQSLNGNKGFHELTFNFGDDKFRMHLPTTFQTCAKQGSSGVIRQVPGLLTYVCPSNDNSVVLNVQRMFTGKPGLLASINGKRLLESKPLIAAELLMDVNQWAAAEKGLTPSQRALFYSQPSLANCQRLSANAMPRAFFSSALACRFTVKADGEPEGYTSSIWVEHGKFVYGFNLWMPDTSYESFYKNIASIAALSAQNIAPLVAPPAKTNGKSSHSTSAITPPTRNVASTPNPRGTTASDSRGSTAPTGDKPGTYYKITMPSGVEFVSSQRRGNNTQYDTYSRGLGSSSRNYVLVVDRMNVTFRPSDYDRSIHELLESMTKSLNVQLKANTMQVESTNLDGMPGRLVSAFGINSGGASGTNAGGASGTNAGHESLILMILGFGPNDTHLITQISDSNNPAQSFSEFRSMITSFKRK